MKRLLKKRWHHLPVGIITAVLLACLIAGSAFAAYTVWHQTFTVTVTEPIEVSVFHEPSASLDPGTGGIGLILHIHNTGGAPLPITVSWECNDIGDIVFAPNYGAGYCNADGAVFGPGTMTLGETFMIYQDGQIEAGKSCWVTVQFQHIAPSDCPAGAATIDVTVARGN